ncbi:hypothetical protein [Evansella cellulosilytica]|uniref:DUF4190 domain-containing protein n=1 Tax=Evansella cellulosilytica (strain ATCC 21833 / DSM 2522 / FERM P-1141 / JCM 9156 / N-4) TaxID=649639 RepID=E6TZ74_EVAC2|nr:hypothetical protein [Evansella cellulosilytica]ADU28936.1 hypothetical protein Bcell_0654 [Evansella cellulosilytica DSM 2522]
MHEIIVEKESNGMAVTALVLGIVGLVIGLIPFIGWFMLPLWFLAIIFGLIGRTKHYQRGMANAGIILGLIAVIYKFGFWVLIFYLGSL